MKFPSVVMCMESKPAALQTLSPTGAAFHYLFTNHLRLLNLCIMSLLVLNTLNLWHASVLFDLLDQKH